MTLPASVELIIARHEEDLRWIRRVPASIRITIYNKGTTPALPPGFVRREGLSVHDLPNLGREAHTYLTHLSNRYAEIAPVTLFCQGHPFDHAPDFHARLKGVCEGSEAPDSFLWYGFLEETDDPHGKRLFVPWSKNPERKELETGRLHEELFGGNTPDLFHFRGGAQFAVTREAVHRRNREFYLRALDLAVGIPLAAHSYERIWDRIFGDPVIDPSSLGTEGVRYLKRIRRLEKGPKAEIAPDSV